MHVCVVVLGGRQPACVLRLVLQSPSSLPFFSLFLGTALVADALSHSRCDREHVNQIGEMLKAALLETEGMYLETGDGE